MDIGRLNWGSRVEVREILEHTTSGERGQIERLARSVNCRFGLAAGVVIGGAMWLLADYFLRVVLSNAIIGFAFAVAVIGGAIALLHVALMRGKNRLRSALFYTCWAKAQGFSSGSLALKWWE